MDNTRETEIARRWLLTDPALAPYRYWRDVTRGIIAETKGLGARPAWTRREAAVFLLAEELQTGVAGDSHLLVPDVGMYQELVQTALDKVDWWTLAEALVDEHALRAPRRSALQKKRASTRPRSRPHPRPEKKTA